MSKFIAVVIGVGCLDRSSGSVFIWAINALLVGQGIAACLIAYFLLIIL